MGILLSGVGGGTPGNCRMQDGGSSYAEGLAPASAGPCFSTCCSHGLDFSSSFLKKGECLLRQPGVPFPRRHPVWLRHPPSAPLCRGTHRAPEPRPTSWSTFPGWIRGPLWTESCGLLCLSPEPNTVLGTQWVPSGRRGGAKEKGNGRREHTNTQPHTRVHEHINAQVHVQPGP